MKVFHVKFEGAFRCLKITDTTSSSMSTVTGRTLTLPIRTAVRYVTDGVNTVSVPVRSLRTQVGKAQKIDQLLLRGRKYFS
jgi:hypothetical protein